MKQSQRLHLLETFGCDVSSLPHDVQKKIETSTLLTNNSKEVTEGATFVAIKGDTHDGHDFINNLKVNCIVIVDKRFFRADTSLSPHVSILTISDTKEFIKDYAPVFYEHPSLKMRVVGITGTNGKTTSTYLLEALYQLVNKKTAVIGTINIRIGNEILPATHTTPDICTLQRLLSEMLQKGVEVVIMEISSHALMLERVRHLHLDAVIWTNITQDHLDFHGNMTEYLNAKLKIFNLLELSEKPEKNAIIFAKTDKLDDITTEVKQREFDTYFFGLTDENYSVPITLSGKIQHITTHHMEIALTEKDKTQSISYNKIGEFNLYNALGCVLEFRQSPFYNNASFKELFNSLNEAVVPGRLESVENDLGALIVVDYAHTPDALENVLQTLKVIPHRKLYCVFGCGGDRDNSKRPLMGAVSLKYADTSVITSDNPRSEDPLSIISMITKHLPEKKYIVEADRKKAIEWTLKEVQSQDIVLIAGKGHEDYQIIGKEKIHFDDREIVREFLKK